MEHAKESSKFQSCQSSKRNRKSCSSPWGRGKQGGDGCRVGRERDLSGVKYSNGQSVSTTDQPGERWTTASIDQPCGGGRREGEASVVIQGAMMVPALEDV